MSFYISRFKGMERQEFEVEIVTPLFLGGSDPKKAEIRVPSIKGALRFWWRALYGNDDLKSMKKREDEIFGSTKQKSSFDLQINQITDCRPKLSNLPKGNPFIVKSSKGTFKLGIIDYLAFGLRDFKAGYSKEHIPDKNKFEIIFTIKNSMYKNEIENAFKMLVHYGGIGAKSRNGFGSLHVEKLNPIKINNESGLTDFTTLSQQSILFDKFQKFNTWTDALSELGMTYKDARLSVEAKHKYEKRLLIAKPIVQTGNSSERHSKPYFLHVNKLQDGKYQGRILFMPYNYYDQSKRKQYFETCKKMNQKILELSGGTK